MEILSIDLTDILKYLGAFYGLFASAITCLWIYSTRWKEARLEELRFNHDVRIKEIQRDIELAKQRQVTLEQWGGITERVHELEYELDLLTNTVEGIQESEHEHKEHMKEQVHDMKDSVKELNKLINKLLLNRPDK